MHSTCVVKLLVVGNIMKILIVARECVYGDCIWPVALKRTSSRKTSDFNKILDYSRQISIKVSTTEFY